MSYVVTKGQKCVILLPPIRQKKRENVLCNAENFGALSAASRDCGIGWCHNFLISIQSVDMLFEVIIVLLIYLLLLTHNNSAQFCLSSNRLFQFTT